MKKTFLFSLLLLTAYLLNSCQQNDLYSQKPGGLLIQAMKEESPLTRTVYDDTTSPNKFIVNWGATDRIGLFSTEDAKPNYRFDMYVIQNNGKLGQFLGDIPKMSYDAQLYAYYPYSIGQTNNTAIKIVLDNQNQTDLNTTAHLAPVDFLAATAKSTQLSNGLIYTSLNTYLLFKPLLTTMSFDVLNNSGAPMSVASITLESVDKNAFYTQATANIATSDGSFPLTPTVSTQTNNLLLTVNGSNVNIANGAVGRFNMIILPIAAQGNSDYPSFFKITVNTNDGKSFTQTKTAPATGFERGKRYIMKANNLTENVI